MSKHIEVKVRDGNEKVTLVLTTRDSNGRLRSFETRQFTVSRQEFERALDDATIEIPWKETSNEHRPGRA